MSSGQKISVTVGFLLILVLLGGTDSLFTRGTLWVPSTDGSEEVTEPDVASRAVAQGFTVAGTTEDHLLMHLPLPAGTRVESKVLLTDSDRAATVAWIDSPEATALFTILKKNLRSSFTADLQHLVDETRTPQGRSPHDVLSFSDPGIHGDRMLFVRIRRRLYEFHVTAGSEGEIDRLMNALTE